MFGPLLGVEFAERAAPPVSFFEGECGTSFQQRSGGNLCLLVEPYQMWVLLFFFKGDAGGFLLISL